MTSVDHTYGSRTFASSLVPCQYQNQAARCLPDDLGGGALRALVLVDMIGSPGLLLSRDPGSTHALWALTEQAAAELGYQQVISHQQHGLIEDDHTPFAALGIPAIDLIDFENLQHWHQPTDDLSHIDFDSMERAARIALLVAL